MIYSGGMKKTILFLVFFPLMASAQTGFICESQQVEITRKKVNELTTLVMTQVQDGTETFNEYLSLPMEDTVDAYQDRYGTYYTVMEQAHLSFPYMPEFLLIYHLGQSSKLYKKGFKALEGEGSPVQLNKMYCAALIKSIQNY